MTTNNQRGESQRGLLDPQGVESEPEMLTRTGFMEAMAKQVRLLMPAMKDGVDPLMHVRNLTEQMQESGPVGMQPFMMQTMVTQEAMMPKGMSLTRKVPGGSVTATVKRRFGLRKGLAKKTTAMQFSRMLHIATHLTANQVDEYELHEYLPEFYSWCEVCDDGCEDFRGSCSGVPE
jgi:hypothetical protein